MPCGRIGSRLPRRHSEGGRGDSNLQPLGTYYLGAGRSLLPGDTISRQPSAILNQASRSRSVEACSAHCSASLAFLMNTASLSTTGLSMGIRLERSDARPVPGLRLRADPGVYVGPARQDQGEVAVPWASKGQLSGTRSAPGPVPQPRASSLSTPAHVTRRPPTPRRTPRESRRRLSSGAVPTRPRNPALATVLP